MARLKEITSDLRTDMMPPLLSDPEIYPSDEILRSVLGRAHTAYKIYMDTILTSHTILLLSGSTTRMAMPGFAK